MVLKCCTQYASKFEKLGSGQRAGKGQFSFQSQRKAMLPFFMILAWAYIGRKQRFRETESKHCPETFSEVSCLYSMQCILHGSCLEV